MRATALLITIAAIGFLVLGGVFVVFGPSKDEYVAPIVFNPAGLSWQQIASSTAWAPRDSAATFVFDGKLWITGGLNGNGVPTGPSHAVEYWKAPHFSDLWASEDGVTWTRMATTSWPSRRSMSIAPYGDALWMFGGWSPQGGYQSDVWRSQDGTRWTRVVANAPFPAREGQAVEVFNGRLYMMGGVNYDTRQTFNDVWYTEDGVTWVEAPKAPWSPRWDHATAVYKGKLWLTAGMDLNSNGSADEWYTEDGMTWTQVTSKAVWPDRQGHMLVPYEGRLWLLGRLNDDIAGGENDVWYSEDGITWTEGMRPGWGSREDGWIVPFKDRLYVFTGMNADWEWTNDVWVSTPTPTLTAPVVKDVPTPTVRAAAAAAYFIPELGDPLPLFEQNADTPLPIASITKLMSALVATEKRESAVIVEELRRMLVVSDNAAADGLAEATGRPAFVSRMNSLAKSLDLSMRFVNPSGIDPKGEGESPNAGSAHDVATLLTHIYQSEPDLFSLLTERSYQGVPNTNELLRGAPLKVIGGKTGETPQARQNLVLMAEAPTGGTVVAVVLGSPDRVSDMWRLLEYVRSGYEW